MPHVTRDEAAVLARAVHDQAGYFWRLCSRMEKTGRTQEPLYREGCKARDAVHGRKVSLHYRGCGVRQAPEPDAPGDRPGAPATA